MNLYREMTDDGLKLQIVALTKARLKLIQTQRPEAVADLAWRLNERTEAIETLYKLATANPPSDDALVSSTVRLALCLAGEKEVATANAADVAVDIATLAYVTSSTARELGVSTSVRTKFEGELRAKLTETEYSFSSRATELMQDQVHGVGRESTIFLEAYQHLGQVYDQLLPDTFPSGLQL